MDLSHSMEIKWQELLPCHSQIMSNASPVPRLAQNTHNPVFYGLSGGSLKNIIPPYSHIIGLQCSHVPLIIWACFPVYSNSLGVCNEAIGGLHSGFYMNLNRLTYVFLSFCFDCFFGAWQFRPRFATIKGLELRPILLSKPSKNVDKQIPEWNLLVPGCVCL